MFEQKFEVFKMVSLNVASIVVAVLGAIYDNAPAWAIVVLILSVALLNGAKAYRLFMDSKRKKAERDKTDTDEKN